MTRRAPEEVYATLLQAGWPEQAAVTMTAIAGAESGYDNAAVGDVGLQDANWGPSFGLFQIRTVKRETGTGGTRDINRLAVGDIEQARAAYVISQGGTDFTPWSVYQTGQYQAYLASSRAAAAKLGGASTAGLAGGDGEGSMLGPEWMPWNWAAGGAPEAVLGGARHIALEGVAVVAGLALVVVGVWLVTRPDRTLRRWQRPVLKAVGVGS